MSTLKIELPDDLLVLLLAAVAPVSGHSAGHVQREARFRWAENMVAEWHKRGEEDRAPTVEIDMGHING